MYKKVSVVLGALALMVAIGFGTSQSYAGEKVTICHNTDEGPVTINVSVSSVGRHLDKHQDAVGECPA